MFRRWAFRKKLKRLETEGWGSDSATLLMTGTDKERADVANALWGMADRITPEQRPEVVAALESAAAPVNHPVIRANAIAALLTLRAEGALDLGRAALREPDWYLRAIAAAMVGGFGDPAAVPDLVPLLDDPEPWVRMQAVGAVDVLGGLDQATLERLEASEKDSDVRWALDQARARRHPMPP